MMLSAEDVCSFLNKQLVERPSFMGAALRTAWQLNPGDIPDDIFVHQIAPNCHSADLLGVLNGLLMQTGQQLKAVNIEGILQFVLEDKNEDLPTS
ncbi:hypothetical protein pEaSNUABM14_00177 [Erwinia phage pEa_SNUABM_14]|uniref:Uncharacterized protein n=1 Tax=Erwinia phage pEa_SNUABM_7 TaxID=2866695 RepID=A0AAE7WSF9_9CAUD|nr:hypothetical protein MPK74_gp178 [Erwinia phage pEa_SNUABM_7]QYW03137.1 hypothetical protein pEaSNUABM13_00178 [Erwinia phage pEa_SNUABM_13]QYW03478.1 hypothetical protein pEaSNUABM34_00176 [Erwinia phage pEa_SNUABM_34]QYW03820.1 hypothetical protein pEaSNUABM45_00177 [Erwinia phage pEa_SNUABM_45]QYW04161.1 hypothetical protein pEaSNUABM46_00177 [Erwinia phage pEa_SNUABM_46]QYW04502.1 hypothetical protein pEaSNUABM14_00177 [Erwinia phage pEa_SNUABM_14]QYW05191.1 hypothetical protein pEaSNU